LQDQVFGDLSEKQLRYVSNILTSGRHLLSLVNDVLDLAKVEAGRMELHWEEFSSRQSISEVITQLSTLATKKELNIISEIEDGLDLIVADRGRFRQVLYNLISNAIKFTPQGGSVKICAKIEASGGPNGHAAVFGVADTGIGIAAEHLETIFESFRQVDNSYSRQYQGTGLGLALTRKLVEMHGGKIWVTSQPGVGSTFNFTIPLVSVPVFSDTTPEEVPLFGK
jgi:signal transduction histidine kinase